MKWRDKGVPNKETYEIEITENGISLSGKSGDALWKWDQIEKFSKRKGNFIFEYKNKRLSYIPVNGFSSKEMLADFISHLEERFGSQPHA